MENEERYEEPGFSDHEELQEQHPIPKWMTGSSRNFRQVSTVKEIQIFDFDNTLFRTPKPNEEIWDPNTIKMLTRLRYINNTSWWQHLEPLRHSGEGYEMESQRLWSGLWMSHVTSLVRYDDPQTLKLLVTGKKASVFKELLNEMLERAGLEFDCVILKTGSATNTVNYKLQVIQDFIKHYHKIHRIVIYDDRNYQLWKFRDYFKKRGPSFRYELQLVAAEESYLRKDVEMSIVRKWVESHNWNCKNRKFDVGELEIVQDAETELYSLREVKTGE